MIELNAAARLVADARGEIEQDVSAGKYKIVEGEGQRWMAVQFPNGRFGVIDADSQGTRNKIRAAGLGEETAIQAVRDANGKGQFHPTMTMR